MAMERPKLAIPVPELHSVRRETISMLGKTYGCGQCSGKYHSPMCCCWEGGILFNDAVICKNYTALMVV